MATLIGATPVEARRREPGHIPGEGGLWVFIFGDSGMFAVLFCAYLVSRSHETSLFNASQLTLNQTVGVINTVLLLSSSLLVALGVSAVRRQAGTLAPALLAGALACGLGFVAMKAAEYGEKFTAGITPGTNSFFQYYFIVTGVHLFHVVLGLGVLIALIWKSRTHQRSPARLAFIEGGACLWHLVDLLWIVLFPLLYLVK